MNLILSLFVVLTLTLSTYICEAGLHQFDQDVLEDVDEDNSDDYLYHLDDSYLLANPRFPGQDAPVGYTPETLEKQFQKAVKAFDEFQYEKCLKKIREYEKMAQKPPYKLSDSRKVTVIAYKAYSYKYLKQYEKAIAYFEDLINLLPIAGLKKECVFVTYLEHAHCYLCIGQEETFIRKVKQIVNMKIGPTLADLQASNFMINHQPCFHDHELIQQDRVVLNELMATNLGLKVVDLKIQDQLVPKMCTCGHTDEDVQHCRRMCGAIGIFGTLITAFSGNFQLTVAAIVGFGYFQIECENCCLNGWGSENCCKHLKQAIQQALNQQALEGL